MRDGFCLMSSNSLFLLIPASRGMRRAPERRGPSRPGPAQSPEPDQEFLKGNSPSRGYTANWARHPKAGAEEPRSESSQASSNFLPGIGNEHIGTSGVPA